MTDEIMQAIAKLSGQEYVDIDARRAKAERAAAARDHSAGGVRDEKENRDDSGAQEGNGPA